MSKNHSDYNRLAALPQEELAMIFAERNVYWILEKHEQEKRAHIQADNLME